MKAAAKAWRKLNQKKHSIAASANSGENQHQHRSGEEKEKGISVKQAAA